MPLSRSEQMSRIRSRDTRPEMLLRRALWSAGLRYRVHGPGLPGRPDVVFPGRKVVVFVDGCFWHGCPLHYRTPPSPGPYWSAKLARNVGRDARDTAALETAGWRVVRVWEHEVREPLDAVVGRVRIALEGGPPEPDQWRVVGSSQVGSADEQRELRLLRRPEEVRYEVKPLPVRRVRPAEGQVDRSK